MAKITLKNHTELLVSQETANLITSRLEDITSQDADLYMFPLFFAHDDGVFSGNMSDIKEITGSSKKSAKTKWFDKPEDIDRFHNDYGYGKFETKYEPGYGTLDVKTQFLLTIGKAKFVDKFNTKLLVMIEWKDKQKEKSWSDLWEIYEHNLDPFGDLVEINKRICKI